MFHRWKIKLVSTEAGEDSKSGLFARFWKEKKSRPSQNLGNWALYHNTVMYALTDFHWTNNPDVTSPHNNRFKWSAWSTVKCKCLFLPLRPYLSLKPRKYQRVVYVREKVAIFNFFFSIVNIHQIGWFFFKHLQIFKTLHSTSKKQINM